MPIQVDQPFTNKPLYKLLVRTFRDFATRQGVFDVRSFASELSMSPEGVYKWLRADRLSADGASKILDLAKKESRALTREDLIVFVLR